MLSPKKQAYLIEQLNKNKKKYSRKKINSDKITEINLSVERFFKRIANTSSPIIGEKTPSNIFYYPYIRKRFKSAKFLFLKRHPLAIVNSYFNRWYNSTYTDDFIIKTVAVIKAYFYEYEQIEEKEKLLNIKYEDLVTDSKKILNQITDFLEIEFDQNMLNTSEKLFKNSKIEKHHKDAHKELNNHHIESYKDSFSALQISELTYLLRHEISQLGYELNEETPVNSRLLKLEKKILERRRLSRVKRRKKINRIKAHLSFYKYLLKTTFSKSQ
jgi:hypothetical protein